MQTAGAFGQVQTSFSFFVNSYASLAEWKSVVDRLSEFEAQTRLANEAALNTGVKLDAGRPETPLCRADVHVATPKGTPLLNATYFAVEPGKALLLKGSSGCGKSTLLRTICGFWPHSRGRVLLAPGARVLALPQRPYLPLGSLRAVLTYPAKEDAVADERLHSALAKVGLADLVTPDAAWAQRRSTRHGQTTLPRNSDRKQGQTARNSSCKWRPRTCRRYRSKDKSFQRRM